MNIRAALEIDGVARVPGMLGKGEVRVMRERVERGIADLRWVEIAGALRPGPGSDEHLWALGRTPELAPLQAAFARTIDEIFGAGVWTPVPGQASGLVSPNLPLAGNWDVPHAAWHVDEPTFADQIHAWGLLGFALLDDVEPGGGATVAIAGSHRLLAALAPERVVTTEVALAMLREDAWFARLLRPGDPDARRRILDEHHAMRGIEVRAVECTGQAGDVVLVDPRCLHTVSANVSPRARLQMRLVCHRAT